MKLPTLFRDSIVLVRASLCIAVTLVAVIARPISAAASSISAQAAVTRTGEASVFCPRGATSCDVAIAGSSASSSGSFGTLDGMVSTSGGLGVVGTANASASFTDTFSFLNATGSSTDFKVGIVSGGSVLGGTSTTDFAELDLRMSLTDTVDSSNMVKAEYILDQEGTNPFFTSGLPTNVLTLEIPDGHSVALSVQLSLDSQASGADAAMVLDPTSVYVVASNPYTADSRTIYPTSVGPANPVPEPASLFLLGSALGGLTFSRRRRQRFLANKR